MKDREFFELTKLPMPSESNLNGSIAGESAPVQSQQVGNTTGTIIEWFPRSNQLPSGGGVIRGHWGGRFTFSATDVVSGEPRVGRTVSFKGYSWGVASKVNIDPQTPQLTPEPLEPEVPASIVAEQKKAEIAQVRTTEKMDGTIIVFDHVTGDGSISMATGTVQFFACDIQRGFAEVGRKVSFHLVGKQAIDLDID